MDDLSALLGRNGFLPHGYCFTWTPGLLWSMVGADGLIAAAYFSIPMAILSFVRKREDAAPSWGVPWLFSAFIFACGITHLMDIWTVWVPDYGLQALTKIATAVISVPTAVALWLLIPKALAIPSVARLQAAVASLESEVLKRRSAEQNLNDSQQSLAVTLASIDAGFVATDRSGRVVRMNAVAERVMGWTEAEARGRSLWEVFQREGRPPSYAARNPVEVIVDEGFTVDTAHRMVAIARDGRRTSIELKVALIRDDDDAVRGLAMVFRDMTRLLSAEADAQRLAAIVQSSSDAIIGNSLDGRITSWNAAAQAMFGYSPEEVIGQPVQMLIPPDREAEEMRILTNLAQGAVVPAFDSVRRAKDGHLITVSLTISPVRDAAGSIVGAAKIVRDVTHQRSAEAKALRLEAENRQVQEATRLKSQFLANMSHELRTPLNAIIGFAELLHSNRVAPDSPKRQQFMGHIATSGRHLLQLINDVLDLSKVESGKFEFFPEPVHLPTLVSEVVDILAPASQAKRIEIGQDFAPAVSDLVVDPARLKQVLYNYLSNAIKFTPAGGRVSVRARPDGATHFRIEVEDTGIGISEADQARLFVEFQQLDTGFSKQHAGTGLGLALTRRLVQAQGGRVGVRSTPGQGSVFHLVLARDLRAPTAAEPARQRLLVVEGDRQVQQRLVQGLAAAGFHVDAASTGRQAVQHAQATAYAAITLDLRLPDQAGLDVLASIRSEGSSRASPVVGVTLPTSAAGAPAMFAVADVLSKPIRSAEIVAAIARLRGDGSRPTKVLVIDDDPRALDLMQATLGGFGIEAVGRLDGRVALAELDEHRPDAIILDLMMPGFDGFATLDALHRLPAWAATPVYIWTSMILSDEEYASLAQSAQAIIGKGGGAVAEMLERLRQSALPAEGAA